MRNNKLIVTFLAASLLGSLAGGCKGKINQVTPPGGNNGAPVTNPGGNGSGTVKTGPGSLTGILKDRNGRPLARARVALESDPTLYTTTDSDGTFTLNGIPSGYQTLLVKMNGREMTYDTQVNAGENYAIGDVTFEPATGGTPIGNEPSGDSNPKLNMFKVDQDMYNQWRATGVAVSGGTIYMTVSDNKSVFKKGSVVKMGTDGKGWKDLGKGFLGLTHPISENARGLALAGGDLLITADSKQVYTVKTNGGVEKKKTSGATDVAAGGGIVYLINSGLVDRSDSGVSSRTSIQNTSGVAATGGVGADAAGVGYFVANSTSIMRIDPQDGGVPQEVISGLTNPIDVAVTNEGQSRVIYVLEQTQIRRFDEMGMQLANFQHEAKAPNAIAVDETGNLYISDFGTSEKDSAIIMYGRPQASMSTYNEYSSGGGSPSSSPSLYENVYNDASAMRNR